jgi:hypothetical protein
MTSQRTTHQVPDDLFQAVYDSPASLPGKHRWVTPERDVRRLEDLLGMPERTIGAPLWVSGDTPQCPKCDRTVNWLDIVSSALGGVHDRAMIARVILGEQKFVNTEMPDAIAGVHCIECGTGIADLRSFKCHNWAYAREAIEHLVANPAGRERA